jgi:hypothetical protein
VPRRTRTPNPSACSRAPNPSRQRRRLGPRRRIELVPPSPVRRLGVALWIRRVVRNPPVRLVWASVLRAAGTPSPELDRRRGSPCAAVPRRRRFGTPQLGSHAHALRSGEDPVVFGAPQRQAAVAPPPSLAAGRTQPPQPLAQIRGRQISIRRPPLAPGRRSNRRVPVNYDPAPALDLSRSIAIQRIRSNPSAMPRVFTNKTLSFPGFATRSSHLIKPLRFSPVFFCFNPKP